MREYARDAIAALVASVPAVVAIAAGGAPALTVASSADVEFCDGYGSAQVAQDLMVWMRDGSVFFRREYDGAEYECDCGLTFHAESRIVGERGYHDKAAEDAEMDGAWNTRAERTCTVEYPDDVRMCSECHYYIGPNNRFCSICGAKVVG